MNRRKFGGGSGTTSPHVPEGRIRQTTRLNQEVAEKFEKGGPATVTDRGIVQLVYELLVLTEGEIKLVAGGE